MVSLASYSSTAPDAPGHDRAEAEGVVQDVVSGLRAAARRAQEAGVPAWNIILDPGLGFAKDAGHDLALLRSSSGAALSALGFPVLYGPSRKRFIGRCVAAADRKGAALSEAGHSVPTATELVAIAPIDAASSEARIWGTAAAVTAAVAAGAAAVRVHDVSQMRTVIAVADAVYRQDER
jgi:dihydropteroate synthase